LWRVSRTLNTVWLSISLLLGIIIGTVFIIVYEQYTFQPFEWTTDPTIVNCYGEDLDEVNIVEAIHYWTTKGHSFLPTELTPTSSFCEKEYVHGFIIIRKKDLPYNTLGTTRRRTFLTKIVAAVVHFDVGTYRIDNVFEHELGHALGYGHIEVDGHIMHPMWEKITPKFWIPDRLI